MALDALLLGTAHFHDMAPTSGTALAAAGAGETQGKRGSVDIGHGQFQDQLW
jgi:hypothetical protein